MTEVPQPEAFGDVFNDADGQRFVNFRCHLIHLLLSIALSPVSDVLRRTFLRTRDMRPCGDWCFDTSAAAGRSGVLFRRTNRRTTVSFDQPKLPKDRLDSRFPHNVEALVAVFTNDEHVGVVLGQAVV